MTGLLVVFVCLIAAEVSSASNGLVRDVVACSVDTRPRVMTDPTGSFTSENFPADYTNDANCQWLIVAQPGQIVNLDFDSFNTQRGFDRVWLYDGDSVDSPVILGLDGSRPLAPKTIHSTQQNMLVSFTTDATTTAAGFSATYTSIDPVGIEDACSAVFRPLILTGSSGMFTSQFYPDPYPFASECQWQIVSPGGMVQLDFTFFLTEPNNDWVQIYDGDSAQAPLIARLSGFYAQAPTGFVSTQPNMFVQFVSDLTNSVRGFNATFTAVPAI